MKQYHIQLDEGDIGKYIFLPGDPARSKKIAAFFENPALVMENREFTTYTGEILGEKVSVVSTGIGAPSTAIAVEELRRIGAHTFLRVGTCGGYRKGMELSDLVVANSAVRDEGTSHRYAPGEFPAIADHSFTNALLKACQGKRFHLGPTVSTDSFYSEVAPELTAVESFLTVRHAAWKSLNAAAAEMEAATLFILGSLHGLRTGCLLEVVDLIGEDLPDHGAVDLTPLLETAIAAMRTLILEDRNHLS